MAFRIEAANRGLIAFVFLAGGLSAQPFRLASRHGTITVTEDGLRFDGSGKKPISRFWDYKNIQEFELSVTEIRILTYEDIRWQLGRDRQYRFDRLNKDDTAKLYPFLSARLDQRFIGRVPEPVNAPEWQAPAKMLHRTGGFNGELKIGKDRIVFEGTGEHASRTWRYTDLGNVSSSSPFELSLTSLDGESRLQLKQALPEDRYNDLWRRVMEANGLKVFQSQMENHHD